MNDRRIFQSVLMAGLALMVIYFAGKLLWEVRSLVSPTVAGLLTAYMLYPAMRWGTSVGIPRGLCVITIMTVFSGVLSLMVYFVVPVVTEEITSLRNTTAQVEMQRHRKSRLLTQEQPEEAEEPELAATSSKQQNQSKLLQIIQQFSKQMAELKLIQTEWDLEETRTRINSWFAAKSSDLLAAAGSKAIELGNFLMIYFFVLVFGLLDGQKFYKTIVRILPNSVFEAGVFILNSTTQMFGDYLRGVAMETIVLGIICLVLLLPICFLIPALGLGIVFMISIIIALTNIVRIVGPIFGGLGCSIIAFSTTSDLKAAFGVMVVALIVQFLDNVLILPLVMEDKMAIHPVLCLIGVFAGGILGGVLGMALAIPFIGGIKVLYRVISVEFYKFNYGSQSHPIHSRE